MHVWLPFVFVSMAFVALRVRCRALRVPSSAVTIQLAVKDTSNKTRHGRASKPQGTRSSARGDP